MGGRRSPLSEDVRQAALDLAKRTLRQAGGGIVRPPGRAPSVIPKAGVVAVPARGERLFRLLGSDEPRAVDFRSNQEKGRPPFEGCPWLQHCGLSMFEHAEQAIMVARFQPLVIVQVELSKEAGFMLAKTFGPGHYSVWGDPEALMGQAIVVVPATEN